MSVDRQLDRTLHRWGVRLRFAESFTWGPWGATIGLGLGVALALASRLWPLWMARELALWAAGLMLAGALIGVGAAWLAPRSVARLARTFDRRFALAERLTTAVEIGVGRLRAVPVMASAQLSDTLHVTTRVNPRAMLPLRASRRALAVFGGLALVLALALWLPNPQEDVLLQRAAVRAAVEEQIEALEEVREEVAETDVLTAEEQAALLQALEEAIAALDEGRATPEEAVAALSEAEQALAPLQDPGAAAVEAGLERAAEELADSELTREIAEALAAGDYQQAAEALAASSSELGESLTREQELAMAQALAQAAQALAGSDAELAAQLSQAAGAIEAGDIEAAREALKKAAQEMGEAGERLERQEAVEGTLADLQEAREKIAKAGGT